MLANMEVIQRMFVRFHWTKWKMVVQLGGAQNRNSFAILQFIHYLLFIIYYLLFIIYWWGFIEKSERWFCSWDVLWIRIVLQSFNLFIIHYSLFIIYYLLFIIYYLLFIIYWWGFIEKSERWLGCAWNKNSFAILQRNQDKRPVPATPTQFHLSPKK